MTNTEAGFSAQGTHYSAEGAAAYATHRHGPDGDQFLDRVFLPHISDLHGETIADIGAGAGPWAMYAAEHGADHVIAIEYQMPMIQNAVKAIDASSINQMGLGNVIDIVQGDAAALPVKTSSVDKAISINVGCNLPDLQTHFQETARILKPGGEFVVTAPINFATVFTDGTKPHEKVLQQINDVLAQVEDHSDKPALVEALNTLSNVHRATFAWKEGRLTLVTHERTLHFGEEILRKLPGLTVPNRYHSKEEYLDFAEQAGFEVTEDTEKHFSSEEERQEYNSKAAADKQLGLEYVRESPFAVFTFKKPRNSVQSDE